MTSATSVTIPTADYAVVIPAYNEGATIRELVIRTLRYAAQVIVVDDGSTDNTAEQLAELPVTLLINTRNQGKAASLWRGFLHALQNNDLRGVITLDGDGQHNPEEIPKLLEAAQQHPDRIIIGSRLWDKAAFPPARYRANRFANFWIAWAAGQPIEDSQSGFRIYPAELLHKLHIRHGKSSGFVFESEVIIEGAKLGFLSQPVAISTVYRPGARASHFRPVMDITKIVVMVAWKLISSGLNPLGLYRSLTAPK